MRDAAQRRVAVGFFDGVHLGHRAILAGADVALTFRRHPLEVLAPEKAPVLLMTVEERVAAIRACGVGEVVVLDFTPELARLPAEAFARKLTDVGLHGQDARSPMGVVVRCGDNWRFGAGGRGDAAFLRAQGLAVEVVPYAVYRNEAISSSRIRRALADGQVRDAAAMLGRPVVVRGTVESGKGLGRELGFPTLNVRPDRRHNLRRGVYAVRLGDAKGVANYGLAPTMGDRAWQELVLEVHLFGPFAAAVSTATVELVGFLRDECRFGSADELKRQIAADCAAAKEMR